MLKPKGRILITSPFGWGEHEKPYDFARYTSFGIKHLLEKSGFEIKITKTSSYFLAIGQLFIAYLGQHVLPKGRLRDCWHSL